jgi:DNA-binding CsgD family transcriptional regulator
VHIIRTPFVGRAGELADLLGSVARVPTAGLVGVVVSGEAGIGKSRLLAEAAARLAEQGWRTLRVDADRLERRVLYAALAAGVRAVPVDTAFAEGLRRDAMAALELAVPDPAGVAFGRACAAVARLFTALCAAGPVAVVVDDLHELDDDSLALLAVVLRRLASAPVGLIVALRPHVAAPNAAAEELLERLADEAELAHLELGTLAPAELAQAIAPVLGAPPDDDLAAEVHRRADGNPYFAAEIAHSLAESRLVALDAGQSRLAVAPQAVRLTRRTAVLRRVMPLAPDTRTVARTLAVLRTVDLARIGLLADVTGLAEPVVAAAFDDLVRAHVVTADDAPGYRFSHDIVADALYDEIGPAECRRLHGQVAARLLADRARGEPVDVLELAWHVAESAAPGDPVAVAVLTEAAQRALTGAPEAAAGFCAQALALLPPAAGERAYLLSLRCRALARGSRPAEAVEPGRAALALLPAGDDRFRTATALISSLFLLGRIDEAIEVADGQISAGPAPATLYAQRAVLLLFAGRAADVPVGVEPASPAEEVVVCGQLAMLTSLRGRHAETVEYLDRALRAAGTSTTLQLQALAVGASTGALAGLVADATGRLRRAEQLTEEAGVTSSFSAELGLTRVVLDWLGGRWDGALEALRTVAVELESRQQATLAGALTAVELDIRTWRGELVQAARLAERPAPAARNMAELHAFAVAGYLAASGDPDGARKRLAGALTDADSAPYGCLLLSRLIDLDLDAGRDPTDLLATLVSVASGRVSPWSVTTLHRTVGLVRRDPAALVEAVRTAEAGGLVFDRARAQLALGELVTDAAPGLLEAYRTFARLGVDRLRRRAGRRLHELGEKVPRHRSRAAGLLTESEERVARLVQQGMRNRDIATALHYSPRSIEVYLSRIYAKLRVSSRLELARTLDAMDAGT